jgi:hypothetical protein
MTQTTPNNFSGQADELATLMRGLCQGGTPGKRTASDAPGLIKLPPVFTSDGKYGDSQRNLVAMIRTISDYEDGTNGGDRPTLSDMPALYNAHGGMPKMSEREMRKVHNWMQQVSFGLRAAVMEQEERSPSMGLEHLSVPERVARRMYSDQQSRRVFVTYASDNRYEIKPLRYAGMDAIKRWVAQEYAQKAAQSGGYGAQPTQHEWDVYGLRGQTRTICSAIQGRIQRMLTSASEMDGGENFRDADRMDARLAQMSKSLEILR